MHVPGPSPTSPRESAQTVVVAVGGHAFMEPGEVGTYEQMSRSTRRMCVQLMTLVDRGYNIVVTHGNGPQVGSQMRRTELSRDQVPPMPLDVLVAETEGSLGYFLQRALLNELRMRNIKRYVVTVVTQVLVDHGDPAFLSPTKPVGPFLDQATAEKRRDEYGWIIGEQKGRGWRRMVPSPRPQKVIQRHMVREAARRGHIVVAAGGGGVPVTLGTGNDYVGVEAVIDKDLTSATLATDVEADLLVILTAVDAVYLNFREDNEKRLGAVTLSECEHYLRDGHFPPGSMGPKVEAVYGFLQRGGRRGLITSADCLADALDGKAGTHFVGRI